MLIGVYTFQHATSLDITCHGSFIKATIATAADEIIVTALFFFFYFFFGGGGGGEDGGGGRGLRPNNASVSCNSH